MDLIEGQLRYRKGKRWKNRWAVLRRVNPAADVLNLVLYQTQANARARQKERGFISLEKYCGLQLLNRIDSNHYNVIVVITTTDVVPLSFESIDQRVGWLGQLQKHFGQEVSFEGIVPHKQKLKAGEATLRFCKERGFFSLTRKDSYRCTGKWNLREIPRYGAVEGGFAFQVAPSTNSGEPSTYYFATRQGTEIHGLFDSVCRAGEERGPEETQQAVAAQEPDEEEKAQPNIFKRAWLRMSKRRKRPQDRRGRTRSDPSIGRRRALQARREVPDAARSQSASELDVDDAAIAGAAKPPLPGYENINVKSPGFDNVPKKGANGYENLPEKGTNGYENLPEIGTNGYENLPVSATPEGYEVMSGSAERRVTPAGYEVMSPVEGTKSMQRFIFSKQKSQERKRSGGKSERDEVAKGENEEVHLRGGGQSSAEQSGARNAGGGTGSSAEARMDTNHDMEATEGKLDSDESPQRNSNGERRKISANRDASFDADDVFVSTPQDEERKGGNARKVSSDGPRSPERKTFSNGAVPMATDAGVDAPSARTPRGFRRPPPEVKIQNLPINDDPHPYVNSPPKTAEYVNLQGDQSGRSKSNAAARQRSQTATMQSRAAGSKLSPYAMYDSTDDSIYHSVESLMPSSFPGYQNISNDPSRCRSFENISGHHYTNVEGAPSYQNISKLTVDQSYVNLPSRRRLAGNLNYIQLAGTDAPGGIGLSPLTIDSSSAGKSVAKSSSDYTWIDEQKTTLLKKTAKMHSDARKENVRRSVPKK